MTVDEAIDALELLREEQGTDLTTPECQAIGISIVVLRSLIPSERDMINRVLDMPVFSTN